MVNVHLSPADKAALDDMLCEIDDLELEHGGPVMSVIVVHDDGAVSSAFWRTVEKHKLRHPGETDAHLIERMREAANKFYEKYTPVQAAMRKNKLFLTYVERNSKK